jgi:long-subunit acyl-CoA synthetase (AMP-forming)
MLALDPIQSHLSPGSLPRGGSIAVRYSGDGQKQRESAFASRVSDLDDIWMIMYTSGRPKGALITYKMCLFNAIHCAMMVGLTSRSKNLVVLPMFYTGGLNIYANPAFHAGGSTSY